jgi:hypothetical protein
VASLLEPCIHWDELEAEHRHWLTTFDSQHQRDWENLLKADYEAALCEAAVRRLLQVAQITVQPNADLIGLAQYGAERRPDYRCARTNPEGNFYVEVANIPIAKAVAETNLPHPFQSGPRNYRNLNKPIFDKCRKKTKQCSDTALPTLLAVGTFHYQASVICMTRRDADWLLTGETSISFMVNAETGAAVGDTFQTTKLDKASFLRPEPASCSIREARTSLSGLLLCGFGCVTPNVVGILHPQAARPFDPGMLPGINFGQVIVDHSTGQLRTVWPDESDGGEEDFDP